MAVGKWFDPNVTFTVDPNVYHASDYSSTIPDYVKTCVDDAHKTLPEFISTCKTFPLNYTEVPINTPSKISIKFYYGPYRGTSSLWDPIKNFNDYFEVIDPPTLKQLSVAVSPPPASSNYNGATHMGASNKHYESGVVWINVYAYKFFHDVGGITWDKQSYRYLDQVLWHEMFHTVGLNDDPYGSIPGLMVYRALQNRPNDKETGVCKFLYGGK
jgi:hypothetical protein